MSFQISSGIRALRLPAAVNKHRTFCHTFAAYAFESIREADFLVQDQSRKSEKSDVDGLLI